jgi:hypothetical protein
MLQQEQALNKKLRRQMQNLGAQNQALVEQNNRMMEQALMSTSCMVWTHGEVDPDNESQRIMLIDKDVIKEAYLLEISAATVELTGDRKFTVRKLTEEDVERIRQERLTKLHGTDRPSIILPGGSNG